MFDNWCSRAHTRDSRPRRDQSVNACASGEINTMNESVVGCPVKGPICGQDSLVELRVDAILQDLAADRPTRLQAHCSRHSILWDTGDLEGRQIQLLVRDHPVFLKPRDRVQRIGSRDRRMGFSIAQPIHRAIRVPSLGFGLGVGAIRHACTQAPTAFRRGVCEPSVSVARFKRIAS